ncbi:type II secretion system F family protein [Litorimonas sp.]|jgi:tight adherence protein B|uniref:type II secretion system F family protein n=1 Tax=Litorimonas sp. TaxID=1892381 RepID=UPI003A850FC5
MDQTTLIGIVVVGFVLVAGYILMGDGGGKKTERLKSISGDIKQKESFLGKLKTEDQGTRRKQIEETLSKIEERQKKKKKKAKSLEMRLVQADWSIKPEKFLIISAVLAGLAGVPAFLLGMNPFLCLGLAFVVGFGLPRFFLNSAITRRQKKFTAHFADAMDIIVRGVRTGLPLNDCLKIIAHESPDPLGAEFRRVVEGESVGIPIEVCLEQLYERMPISEVNFFATVLNIQKSTGGNLGESLANLSAVLRGRKILREKIKALSAEAKMSAIIIASLPIVVMLLVTMMSPDYMNELYFTSTGQRNMMIGAVMMFMGTFMMRKMINFKF